MTSVVLVTGASGFIGTWVLKELLARGCAPVAFDVAPGGERWTQLLGERASQVRFVAGDILDAAALARTVDEHGVTHVIHLAAWLTPRCHADPYRGCEINVLGAMRLFETVRAQGGRIRGFSYASSIAVYGRELDDASDGDASLAAGAASADLEPQTFYGAFKRATELIASQYWRHHQIPSVGLRPFVVYGPGREHGLTAAPTLAARAVARGERYTIGFSGATGFEFVGDTAAAFVRGALDAPPGCWTIDLPGEAAPIEHVIDLLEQLRPGARSLLRVEGPPLPYPVHPDGCAITSVFPDWQATSLIDGLRRTMEFYGAACATSA